jgi:hypothetical protein
MLTRCLVFSATIRVQGSSLLRHAEVALTRRRVRGTNDDWTLLEQRGAREQRSSERCGGGPVIPASG